MRTCSWSAAVCSCGMHEDCGHAAMGSGLQGRVSFQAMVAELLGMDFNRVDLTNRPGVSVPTILYQQMSLSAVSDIYNSPTVV